MSKKLWDIFEDGDSYIYRVHLGKSTEPGPDASTVDMQWTDYHFGDESRPE